MKAYHFTGNEPEIKRLMSYVGYKGKRISMSVCEEVSPMNTYWDEGARYDYTIVNISTGQAIPGETS